MKENGDDYVAFLPEGMTIDSYRQENVDPASSEMEELSLKAAYDMLFDRAGIELEVSYLDRSPGERANKHTYSPQKLADKPEEGLPMAQVLYRPFVVPHERT